MSPADRQALCPAQLCIFPEAQQSSLVRVLIALTLQYHHFSWCLFCFFLHKIYHISHSLDVFTKINCSLNLIDILPEQEQRLWWLFPFLSTINSDTSWEANYIGKAMSILSEMPFLDVPSNHIYSAFIIAHPCKHPFSRRTYSWNNSDSWRFPIFLDRWYLSLDAEICRMQMVVPSTH